MTLAECGFAHGIGAKVDLSSYGLVPEFVLFGEDASRMLISCDPENVERIQQIAVQFGLSAEAHRRHGPGEVGNSGGRERRCRGKRFGVAGSVGRCAGAGLHVETEERLVPGALQKELVVIVVHRCRDCHCRAKRGISVRFVMTNEMAIADPLRRTEVLAVGMTI